MKASLKNHHQSPRKTRLVTDLLKGQKVAVALAQLDLTIRKSAGPVKKALLSAIANAKNNSKVDEADLYIKSITVDKGRVVKRSRPMAHGRAFPVRHRLSHINIILDSKTQANT